MSANGRDDGWPFLEREPLELPTLPPRPTPQDHSRAYGTTLVLWSRLWPRVVDALEWLRGAVMATRGDLEKMNRELLEEIRKARTPSVRPKLPSMSAFAPEQTAGGGIHIQGEAWIALQRQVQDFDEAIERLEREKIEAQAETRGAKTALAELERTWKGRRDVVLFVLALLVPLAGLASWVLTHFLHL